jgi:CheY-like chemotaxis protein
VDKKEVFKKFIEESEIMVVDKNANSRSRLLKIVSDLGGKRHMIHTAGSLEEATGILASKKISLILSDYFITGGSGFDLFKMIREQQPTNKKLCLVLVTSNISQTAVAKAAEEDVDSFIIKPYTLQSIHENLISTIVAKVSPSEYVQKIDAAKEEIKTGNLDKATELLTEAMGLNSKPALAMFYMGQIEYMRKYLDKAQASYKDGLGFNTIHFKCLVGLYELFMKESKFVEAYQVVKKISKYFPANPDRLAQIVRLTIRTQNYRDMQFYYEVFTSLEERPAVLVNYIGAGLFISGKYLLTNDETDLAVQYFDNIAVSCSEYTKFLRAIITLLSERDKAKDAEKYLSRFPISAKNDDDYVISDFLLSAKMGYEPSFVVKRGLDVYNRKIRDVDCMRALISAMEMSGYKPDKLAKYKAELEGLKPEIQVQMAA